MVMNGSSGNRQATRCAAVGLGLVLDAVLGEPPRTVHPVAAFGSVMDRIQRRHHRDAIVAGALYVGIGVAGAIGAGRLLERTLGRGVAAAVAVAVASASRELNRTAQQIGMLLEAGDLDGARAALPRLVGRDPSDLDDKEMARAVVESVAENLSDAVVATALWGIMSGARGALAHRAVNTLDAMVGYRNERYRRFGWASARLDDVMGWPAARLTALLVAVVTPAAASSVWCTVRRDAMAHPSPNAGVAEAAFAGALGLRLGGSNRYGGELDVRPFLGVGRPAEPADIARAVTLARRVTVALGTGCALGALGARCMSGALRVRGASRTPAARCALSAPRTRGDRRS
jgi:adenosylcobinamide-phosphate synthase